MCAAVAKPDVMPDTAPCVCGRSWPAGKGRSRAALLGECCGPLLQGKQLAADAEALMRSRYTAYMLGDAAYLRGSWHPDTCPADLSLGADVQWLGLKVERHTQISPMQAEVVFVARYRLDGRVHRLAERSRFVLEQGRWLYHKALT